MPLGELWRCVRLLQGLASGAETHREQAPELHDEKCSWNLYSVEKRNPTDFLDPRPTAYLVIRYRQLAPLLPRLLQRLADAVEL